MNPKRTSDEYWRRQYVTTKKLDQTNESNTQALYKSFLLRNLQLENSTMKLTEEKKPRNRNDRFKEHGT